MQLLLVLMIFFFANTSVYAKANYAGKILMAIGDVTVAGKEAKRRGKIFKNNIIVTGEDSSAQIIFKDGTLLNILANSKIDLQKYEFTPKKPQENELSLKIVTGTIKFATGDIAKHAPDKFELSTDLMTIGVRGTNGGASSSSSNGQSNDSAFVLQGALDVVASDGSSASIDANNLSANAVTVSGQSNSDSSGSSDSQTSSGGTTSSTSTSAQASNTAVSVTVTNVAAVISSGNFNTSVDTSIATGTSGGTATSFASAGGNTSSTPTTTGDGGASSPASEGASTTTSTVAATTPIIEPPVPSAPATSTNLTTVSIGASTVSFSSQPAFDSTTTATSYTPSPADLIQQSSDMFNFIQNPANDANWMFGSFSAVASPHFPFAQFYNDSGRIIIASPSGPRGFGYTHIGVGNTRMHGPPGCCGNFQHHGWLGPDLSFDVSPLQQNTTVGNDFAFSKVTIDSADVYYGFWNASPYDMSRIAVTQSATGNNIPATATADTFFHNQDYASWIMTDFVDLTLPTNDTTVFDNLIFFQGNDVRGGAYSAADPTPPELSIAVDFNLKTVYMDMAIYHPTNGTKYFIGNEGVVNAVTDGVSQTYSVHTRFADTSEFYVHGLNTNLNSTYISKLWSVSNQNGANQLHLEMHGKFVGAENTTPNAIVGNFHMQREFFATFGVAKQ